MSRVRADIFTNSTADGPPNFPNGYTVTGITTQSNLNVTGVTTTSSIVVGAAHTLDSQGARIAGIVTATSFIGDGSQLTGVSGWEQRDAWLYNG